MKKFFSLSGAYKPAPSLIKFNKFWLLFFAVIAGVSAANAQVDLQVTEIYSGQSGTKLTADWFEVENKGDVAWVSGVDGDLYYDDESAAAPDATLISGITDIQPGEAVIIIIDDNAAEINTFQNVWGQVIDITALEIGITDGAGLGSGGDAVTLWIGDPTTTSPVDSESYPDTELNDGQTYDVDLAAFSGANGAVTTVAMGGDGSDVPNVGSPGNGAPVPLAYELVITEIFSGQEGTDLTADWFEIKNNGNASWNNISDGELFYDDVSAASADATVISGITEIEPGESVIVLITGNTSDITTFEDVWSPVIDLTGVQIGYTDGAGLGGGGDAVTLWVEDPYNAPVDSKPYPDTAPNDGRSYDTELSAFSTIGNTSGAVKTLALGGDALDVPNIASPGNGSAIPIGAELMITEIFSGQEGTKLTEDWFEIKNIGETVWSSGTDEDLYYDDESADPLEATLIRGITDIQPGESVIVVVTDDPADITAFRSVWEPVADLTGVEIGYTDGAGLSGGGDMVTLWVGDPTVFSSVDSQSYPDTAPNDGHSYDVELGSFSIVGNANGAVRTIALGGNASDVPNIASPGDQGAPPVDPDAPVITADPASTTAYINVNEDGPTYISGVINDPTDPAASSGIDFDLTDADSPAGDLSVTVSSDNQTVVPDANLVLSGTDAERNLIITPAGAGYANITITVTDPDLKIDNYVIGYAASEKAGSSAATRFHTGSSDASTAITSGADYMWVGDDEDQVLRLYNRNNSGYPVKQINFASEVSTGEIDIEGSFRTDDTIYWMGSHTEPGRSVIFKVAESGSGESATLAYEGKYTDLREDILAWDANNGHGLGADYFGFSSVFEVEGLSMDPNNPDGALLALRGPLYGPNAVIVPVTNFRQIISETPVANSATFGAPVEMDLERRTFRSMDCNENGCLIIAGPAGSVTDFRLFTWSGNAADAPELRSADLMSLISLGSYEGIAGLPEGVFTGSDGDAMEVQLLVDMGTFDYYNDGSEAKDLPRGEWKKFRSERVTLGPVETAPDAYPGDVVITEVMQNPSAVTDANGEYFELYNSTRWEIDINGWTITDNGIDAHTIDNGGPLTIPAGEYIVLGSNTDQAVNGGVMMAYGYGSGIALGNGDDEIILKATDGTTVDSIAWDGGNNWPDPNGISMSLQSPVIDNSLAANWCTASTAFGDGDFGTPGSANDCPLPPAAELHITEAWVGQAGQDLTADWFEITNFGDIAWVSGTDADLYYDDESQDPAVADLINGISEIQPGQSVIVVIGSEADATAFYDVWSPGYDLTGVEVGWTDGAGLGQGGDGVTLFLGTPSVETVVDYESFSAVPSGFSYDVVLAEFSQEGVGTAQTGSNVAVASSVTNDAGEPAIASPGNKGPLEMPDYNLQITEIFSGQEGDDLTADWFEIVNTGTSPWVSGIDPDLFYDDESASPADATLISGIDEILPGQTAIVLVTGSITDITIFANVWTPVLDFSGVEVGYTDGAGLGGGGDVVTLWAGDPNTTSPVDTESYPETELNDGQSYDVDLSAFSLVGNANGAVQTLAMGGNTADVPLIGSPGNGLAISPVSGLEITEIFSGQAGTDLTADWFEIINNGTTAWVSGTDPELYYDDESADPLDAVLISGINDIQPGERVIVVVGTSSDVTDFYDVWNEVAEIHSLEIGYADGAGLGGGGDVVTLWAGDSVNYLPADMASYPDTELNDGQSYDIELDEFSTEGNASYAVRTNKMGGSNSDVPNIASPGNSGPVTSILSGNPYTLNVFPNPGSGVFEIQVKGNNKLTSAKVFDLTGRMLFSKQFFETNSYSLNLTELPDAVFILQLEGENGVQTVRVTKR